MDGTPEAHLHRKTPDLQRTSRSGLALDRGPLVVAAVHSPETLHVAESLRDSPDAAPDLLELRVDHFAHDPGALDEIAIHPPRPLIVTVRRPDEGGGVPDLEDAARQRLYARFLGPMIAAVDVEMRSLGSMAEVTAEARRQGTGLIASFHDFQGVPDASRLRDLAGQAVDAGADVFKVAATTRGPADLARLLDFLAAEDRIALAVMGMGRLGKVSRLALAAAGSVLNYGFLGDAAQVPGQWPAAVLRARIEETRG